MEDDILSLFLGLRVMQSMHPHKIQADHHSYQGARGTNNACKVVEGEASNELNLGSRVDYY